MYKSNMFFKELQQLRAQLPISEEVLDRLSVQIIALNNLVISSRNNYQQVDKKFHLNIDEVDDRQLKLFHAAKLNETVANKIKEVALGFAILIDVVGPRSNEKFLGMRLDGLTDEKLRDLTIELNTMVLLKKSEIEKDVAPVRGNKVVVAGLDAVPEKMLKNPLSDRSTLQNPEIDEEVLASHVAEQAGNARDLLSAALAALPEEKRLPALAQFIADLQGLERSQMTVEQIARGLNTAASYMAKNPGNR